MCLLPHRVNFTLLFVGSPDMWGIHDAFSPRSKPDQQKPLPQGIEKQGRTDRDPAYFQTYNRFPQREAIKLT